MTTKQKEKIYAELRLGESPDDPMSASDIKLSAPDEVIVSEEAYGHLAEDIGTELLFAEDYKYGLTYTEAIPDLRRPDRPQSYRTTKEIADSLEAKALKTAYAANYRKKARDLRLNLDPVSLAKYHDKYRERNELGNFFFWKNAHP